MRRLAKGENVGIATLSEVQGPLTLALSWTDPMGSGEADVSVLLLGEGGKVRGDGDFFFYNHPAGEDGAVQLLGTVPTGSGSQDCVQLDLGLLSAEVAGVVVAASRGMEETGFIQSVDNAVDRFHQHVLQPLTSFTKAS